MIKDKIHRRKLQDVQRKKRGVFVIWRSLKEPQQQSQGGQ